MDRLPRDRGPDDGPRLPPHPPDAARVARRLLGLGIDAGGLRSAAHAITRGAGLTIPPGLVYYRSLSRPLASEAGALRADFARLGVQGAIIDSLIPASGEEPEGTGAAISTLNALRGFTGVTRLAISHVSKTSAEQTRGALRPFGSVFMRNLVRSAWEIRRDEDAAPEALHLAAFHRKHNMGPKAAPISLALRFATDSAVTVAHADLADAPDLLARAGTSTQILAALRPGAQSVAALADTLRLPPDTVRRSLNRLASRDKVHPPFPSPWGQRAPNPLGNNTMIAGQDIAGQRDSGCPTMLIPGGSQNPPVSRDRTHSLYRERRSVLRSPGGPQVRVAMGCSRPALDRDRERARQAVSRDRSGQGARVSVPVSG